MGSLGNYTYNMEKRSANLEHLSIAGHVLQVVKISYIIRLIAYARNRGIFVTTNDSVESRMHADMKKQSVVYTTTGRETTWQLPYKLHWKPTNICQHTSVNSFRYIQCT
jgi:hypothetical protein